MRHGMMLFGPFAALVLAGCTAEEEPEAEVAPVAETVPAAPALEPVTATVQEGGVILTVAQQEGLGQYVADQNGRALYMLESDPQGQSTCYDACAQVWPPYTAQGTPTAGEPAIQANLLGTIQRRDGSMQVTYGGHPLYYYARDQGPGQVTGQDVHDDWGEWYLVTPQGEKLEGHGEGHS